MVTTGIAPTLMGRQAEREALDRLLEVVRGGRSSVLVLRGEAGIGKSALLDYAVDSAPGFRVVKAVGVESGMELPFAALQQLCSPMLERLERLAGPQRDALQVAFGLSAGCPPDQFLVALAVLSLLSDAAEEQPVLAVVEDAEWLDRTSSRLLAFVARRLLAEPVALVFTTREPSDELNGLPDVVVEGLSCDDARALFESAIHVRLDAGVERRIITEARGNPLALLELGRWLTMNRVAGGFGLPAALSVEGRIEESFLRCLGTLPADTRQLLVIAAAEPAGEAVLVWRAAERLGIRMEAAEPAEAEGLVTFDTRVTFRHPMLRSVVYRSAPLHARRQAHRALAQVIDSQLDSDRRAWHLAQAVAGPDEEVAAELERSAGRAQARGGMAAAAAFLEKAASLSLDSAKRAQRALAAAQAARRAGALEAALRLLATAEAGPLNELQRAQTYLLRAQTTFDSSRGNEAPSLLLKAAKRFERLDPALARETYLEAFAAVVFAGRLASVGAVKVATAARAAPISPQPPRASDLLLDGLVVLVTQGHAAATPALKRALDAFASDELPAEEGIRWLWLAGATAASLWEAEAWDALSRRLIRLARDAGALTALTGGLLTRAKLHVLAGEFAAADSLTEETAAISAASGIRMPRYGALALAAFRGRETDAPRVIEAAADDFFAAGEGTGLTAVGWATAVLYNGLGRYEDALAAAQQAVDDRNELRFSFWALPELIEAAARSGQRDRGAMPLRRLTEMTRASGTDWALGIQLRSRALLSDGEIAERHYREAIARLRRTRIRFELARAHLLYGEWLRRERRRVDAREQLRGAEEMFVRFGAEAFAGRARIELKATGERARKRCPETRDELTPREAQISRLVAEGQTNQEIAAQLFISASTVDYHLRKAFRKLGVKSRTQLAHRVLGAGAPLTRAQDAA